MGQLSKYQVGKRVFFPDGESGEYGLVVQNYKMPDDICINWDNGLKASYDQDFLEEHKVEVVADIFEVLTRGSK